MAFGAEDIQKKVAPNMVLAVIAVILVIGLCPLQAAPASSSLDTTVTISDRSGREVLSAAAEMNHPDREDFLMREILLQKKSIQENLRAVHWIASGNDGASSHTITLYVSPDYLSVGSTNPVRVPLTPSTAQAIADQLDCVLPTRLIVNKIYQYADSKLQPQPFSPDLYNIESVRLWLLHSDVIDAQIDKASTGTVGVVAGIKKDVVITNRLAQPLQPPRVAIYGWHMPDGEAIQPLSLVHRREYVDYSHGIRLISNTMEVDGKPTEAKTILADPHLAPLLSDEGPLTSTTIRY